MSIDSPWHFCIASLNSFKPDLFQQVEFNILLDKKKCEIDGMGFVCERPWFCILSTLEVKYVE